MTFRIKALSTTALFLATVASAHADPTASASTFATGGPVGGTQPDSITVGGGSVWVEYGNTADSTGAGGSSTIVQYSLSGAIQHTYSLSGEVDGLKIDPATGIVWALQNQDANSTISFINPTTNTVSGPLTYGPPYQYTTPGPLARGYDDIAFLNGKVYLSYTNPVNPTDPVLQILNNGNNPTGTLTTTSILTAAQTNPLFTSSSQNPPDIDSLKSTPNGDLVLTSEGDGLGPQWATSDGRYTLIANPGTPQQTVTNVRVTNQAGVNVNDMDDVIFPDATSGWLFVAGTPGNVVDKVYVTGLTIGTPIIALGSFNEVATVNPTTGVVETPLLNIDSPHGMDFLAAPEPSTWAMMLVGFGGLGFMGYRASAKRRAALAA
jgi:PEP-CTERM motif